MSIFDHDRLREIRTFPQLVKYLRDELNWPIDSDDFDERSFDYTAEELGIDAKTAAKIQEIKQLRPLATGQPWGIFFIKFEPKRLPVVALRRILSKLVIKKRASDNKADRAAWDKHDLLFISNYGEGEERQITFAHFTDNSQYNDLDTLKVLGWDNDDTVLTLDHVHDVLHEKLRWPQDESALDVWRKQWRAAFELRHREVITTSTQLALRLAELARDIRKRCNAAMKIETEKGPLRALMKSFQQALIHDLKEDDFADMYAQTIAYGLLSARISRPAGLVANNLADMIPDTNPFLKEMMETFLSVGGRKWNDRRGRLTGIDFDELGVNDVVDTLRDANMEAVLRDFGNRNPQEDPVIHFYELFLKEYDAKKRMQRGVFYTPKPVVSYIVRSVHELLQNEFALADGLADTTTWAEMLLKHKDLKLPEIEVVDPKTHKLSKKPLALSTPFVQILDPATGTATFLVEVIDVIHKTMLAKWEKQGHTEMFDIPKLWNEYVPKHLLPRLHGYELMMAPYAIAHMKIGLKLFETGYKFGSGERARIYLTNALEPPQDFSDTFEQMAPALAHEAQAVNDVKRHQRFTVVIGNPPYSGHSWNLTPELRRAVEPYKFVDGQRIKEKGALQLEKSIQDDYVKFFRYSQVHITNTGIGLIGLVTSHGFLDNPFLRGMRWSLLSDFRNLFVLDLHGNGLRHEKSPDGSDDTNIFDITRTGAAISFLRKTGGSSQAMVNHAEIWGDRDAIKYPWLSHNSVRTTPAAPVAPGSPSFLLIPQNRAGIEEYDIWCPLNEIMPLHSKGAVTGRDAFVIDFDEPVLLRRMLDFAESRISDEDMVAKYNLNPTAWWDVAEARRRMPRAEDLRPFVRPLLYRPFDVRPCFYHPAVFMSPRRPVMTHMDSGRPNLLLISSRMTKGECFQHVTVARGLAEAILLSSKTSNNAIIFPLHLNADNNEGDGSLALGQTRHPNFGTSFADAIHTCVGLKVVDGDGNFSTTIGAEDVLKYIMALLHSPTYRSRYASPLTRDFPRLPLTQSIHLLVSLAALGGELLSMHMLESRLLEARITTYTGPADSMVEKVSYARGTVWLDKKQKIGFAGVPEAVWNFHIGGYQVCQKWLKDRKGRTLSKDDLTHYGRIVVALNETIRLMKEIDQTIEKHGGWPGAFITDPKERELPGKKT